MTGPIRLSADIRKRSGGDARLALLANDDIFIDSGVDVRSSSGQLIFELFAERGEIRATNIGRIDLNGGEFIVQFEDGARMSSSYDMPDRCSMILLNDKLGSSRRRVDVRFGGDVIKFDYSGREIDLYPSAIDLRDSSSDGFLYILLVDGVDAHLYNLGVIWAPGRGWRIDGIESWGVINSNALDGIPEMVGDLARLSFGPNPDSGYTPVVEVSDNLDEMVDRYIVVSPAGQAQLDAYLASLAPPPIPQVVQQVEKASEQPFIGPIQPTPETNTPDGFRQSISKELAIITIDSVSITSINRVVDILAFFLDSEIAGVALANAFGSWDDFATFYSSFLGEAAAKGLLKDLGVSVALYITENLMLEYFESKYGKWSPEYTWELPHGMVSFFTALSMETSERRSRFH